MRVIIILLLCVAVHVQGLDLQPATFSNVIPKTCTFSITDDSNVKDLLVNNFNDLLLHDELWNKIAEEIIFSSSVEDSTLKKLTWRFDLSGQLGSFQIVDVVANIVKKQVTMTVQRIDIIQPIPVVYESKQHCARTGPRRYGDLFGPREMECHWHQVPRGLTLDEIAHIHQALSEKIPEAVKLLRA